MKLVVSTIWLGLALMLPGTALTFLSFGLGRLLPPGEVFGYTMPTGARKSGYVMDAAHRLAYRLPWNTTSRFAINPANADEIAFTWERAGNLDIYIGNLLTGETRRLVNHASDDYLPAWSPDGRWMTFVSNRSGVVKLHAFEVGWGVPRQVVTDDLHELNPAWSPDGRWIAFTASDTSQRVQVYVIRSDCRIPGIDCAAGEAVPVTSSAGADYLPAWSPDGKWLAFVSDRSGQPGVYLLDTACLERVKACIGQNARHMVTSQTTYRIEDVSWAQDSRMLRIVANASGRWGVYALPLGCDLMPDGCDLELLMVAR